jgi:hypothetical protein
MKAWITSHKTEIGFAISCAVLAASTGCAILGLNAGDLVRGGVSTAQSEPLGFDAKGMSVNDTLDALDASARDELARRRAWNDAFDGAHATVAPNKKFADELDTTATQIGTAVVQAANQQIGGATIAGIGITSLTTPLLGLMLARKQGDKQYDMGRADKEADLNAGLELAAKAKGNTQAGTDANA